MIDFSTAKNRFEVRNIWTTCFGDTEQYARFLFERLLEPENILVYSAGNGEAAAMLCYRTFTARTPKGTAEGAYIFGVATMPSWRNRGFSTALIAETERRLSERGIALSFLVPAGPGLFDFYRKQGFETVFSVRRAVYADDDLPASSPCRLSPCRLEALRSFRNEFYAGRRLFVDWDERYLAYIDAEARALGGGTFSVEGHGETGYVVCYPYKGAVIVKESAFSDRRTGDVLAALRDLYGPGTCRVHLPVDFETKTVSRAEPFAMVKWYDKEKRAELESEEGLPAYAAHVLDGPTLGVPLRDV